MTITQKSKKLIDNYIIQKVFDPEERINKSTKMRNAGYTKESVSKSISAVESSRYFSEMATNLASKTGTVANYLSESIQRSIEAGELEEMDLKDRVLALKTMVQICSILTPSFKQKESFKSENGELKTVWKTLN